MADAQFVIDVAAQVSGADATSSELDRLSDMLSHSGIRTSMFEDALASLSGDLARTSAAANAAHAELADGRAKYAELEKAAVRTGRAVERARARGAKTGDPALVKIVAQANAAHTAVADYATELDKLENKSQQAAAAQTRVSAQMANVAKISKRVRDRLGDTASDLGTFRGALGDIGGPIAEFGERLLFPAQAFVDLREKFSTSTAAMTVGIFGAVRVLTAMAQAVAMVTAAVAAGAVALAAYAVKVGDVARSMSLSREAAARLNPALADIPWADIARDTGATDERLNSLASTLSDAGVAASDMPAALRAIATAEAALGEGGADKFIEQLRAGKSSVSELAAEIDSKLGDIATRRMLSLEAQGNRLKTLLGAGEDGLFSGMGTDSALKGLSKVVSLFDKNTAVGKALRAALTGVLDPLISNAQTAAVVVEAFVLGLAIGALKIYNAFKPAIDRVAELLGLDGAEWDLDTVLDAVSRAAEALVPYILGTVAVLGGLVIAAGAVAGALIGLTVAIGSLMTELGSLIGSALSAGVAIASGLADGIRAGAGAVISAITGVVGGAIAAAKSMLGIASPSKAFAELGVDSGEGMQVGLRATADDVQAAAADMVDPSLAVDAVHAATSEMARGSDAPAVAGSSTSSTDARQSSATTITIHRIELPGVTDGEAFVDWIEGVAMQGGVSLA
jgi:hypothetical protein